jgi:hypothetical protein
MRISVFQRMLLDDAMHRQTGLSALPITGYVRSLLLCG